MGLIIFFLTLKEFPHGAFIFTEVNSHTETAAKCIKDILLNLCVTFIKCVMTGIQCLCYLDSTGYIEKTEGEERERERACYKPINI